MKKQILFLLIFIVSTSMALFAQIPAKEMEKNIRQIYKDLLKETDTNKDKKISKDEYLAIYKDKKRLKRISRAGIQIKTGFSLKTSM